MEDVKTDNHIEKPKENGEGKTHPVAEDHPRNSQFAENTYNLAKHGGVNFVANSAISLGITYNVMPTEPAQKFIGHVANFVKPIVSGYGAIKDKLGFGKQISSTLRAINIRESARSTAEIICMCIAGTLLLVPMKWMSDHKPEILDKIDRWKNTKRDENITSHESQDEEIHEKQGWGKLLAARAISVAAVLGIDAAMQNFNNKRVAQGKGNFDTLEWKLGGKLYDKLPTSLTDKIVNFFALKGSSNIDGVQKAVQERLKKTVGDNPKKLIFAEQSRFFSKEMILTGTLAMMMYPLVETGIMSKILSKIGFKKAKEQHQAIDDILPDIPFVDITKGKANLHADDRKKPEKKYADKVKPRSEYAPRPQESFTNKHINESSATPQLSM